MGRQPLQPSHVSSYALIFCLVLRPQWRPNPVSWSAALHSGSYLACSGLGKRFDVFKAGHLSLQQCADIGPYLSGNLVTKGIFQSSSSITFVLYKPISQIRLKGFSKTEQKTFCPQTQIMFFLSSPWSCITRTYVCAAPIIILLQGVKQRWCTCKTETHRQWKGRINPHDFLCNRLIPTLSIR